MVNDGRVSAVVVVEIFASRSKGAERGERVTGAAKFVRGLGSCMTASAEEQGGQSHKD